MLVNIDEISTPSAPAEYALALAATLEVSAEITLGSTDQELCARALKAYAAQLIASDNPFAYLRNTPDEIAVVSSANDEDGRALRISFRNGHSIFIGERALRWYLKHDLKDSGEDFLPDLAALLARHVFRSMGGKKAQGCTLQEWVFGDA